MPGVKRMLAWGLTRWMHDQKRIKLMHHTHASNPHTQKQTAHRGGPFLVNLSPLGGE
ncbi:MAG: hypothetical protein RL509_792 [Pseudomonadota bacterium]